MTFELEPLLAGQQHLQESRAWSLGWGWHEGAARGRGLQEGTGLSEGTEFR